MAADLEQWLVHAGGTLCPHGHGAAKPEGAQAMLAEYWEERGFPWEYDPGPPRNRKWPRLFAETPNFRALGKAITGKEEFRWHFGPMFYRGRLGDHEIKVLIVGQEGAQDESLSHRSFTGGTGGRMQNLLNHIGITESYLFTNTFVYPIFGQYGTTERLLAQHPDSPIREHREELFDYAVQRNRPELHLAIAVGRAAKESLASWVESHGGQADPDKLHLGDSSKISLKLKMVGVLHPGGASKGGAVTKIKASFVKAIKQIDTWAAADSNWLPVDPGGSRSPASQYKYTSDPIPFRDFAYGTAWRMGRGATSSNRKNSQQAIQMFGEHGKYGNKGHSLKYLDDASGSKTGYGEDPGDLSYEPPKSQYKEFDRGPGSRFAKLLQGGLTGLEWPDFTALGLRCEPSFGTGPIYRGRLRRPSILVIADQQSHDDHFTGRALTGKAGQHLQAFLKAAGLTESYGILRVLPVDMLDDDQSKVRTAVDTAEVRAIHAEAVRRAKPEVLVFCGPLAKRLAQHVTPAGTPTIEMKAHGQSGANADWRRALTELSALAYRRDIGSPTFDYQGERLQIERHDLPFGTLRWQGSSGDRGLQPKRGSKFSFDYYKFVMPDWAFGLEPSTLSNAEAAAAMILKNA
jgi:uracil-DNA glycosylase